MDIKIGDYVRTKYGIAKYIDNEVKSLKLIVIDRYIAYDHLEGYENVIAQSEIIKSRSNIIDLIEVGDYVNGHRVIFKGKNEIQLVTGIFDINKIIIKSIVTHEQFSQMEYKVGE